MIVQAIFIVFCTKYNNEHTCTLFLSSRNHSRLMLYVTENKDGVYIIIVLSDLSKLCDICSEAKEKNAWTCSSLFIAHVILEKWRLRGKLDSCI